VRRGGPGGASLEFDDFAHARQRRIQFETLMNPFSEGFALCVFTVGKKHEGFAGRDGAQPIQQILLTRVCAESPGCMNLRAYYYALAVDADGKTRISVMNFLRLFEPHDLPNPRSLTPVRGSQKWALGDRPSLKNMMTGAPPGL